MNKKELKYNLRLIKNYLSKLRGNLYLFLRKLYDKTKCYIKSPTLNLSLFLSIGILFSELFNVYAYASRGANRLMTWYKSFEVYEYEPTVRITVIFSLFYSILIFFLSNIILAKKTRLKGIVIFRKGLYISTIICLISQLLFSSAMRFAYEFSFCLIVTFGLIIQNVFIKVKSDLKDEYQETWDLLKFIIPLCISYPVLLGSSGLITSFYTEQEFIQLQLYRHISMSLYFIIGSVIFIIYPLLKRLLELRESNQKMV